MSNELTVGLSPFCEYINTVGTERINVIRAHKERYTNPGALGWWPYTKAHSALKAAIAAPDPQTVLSRMVAEAPRNMDTHYAAIAEGIEVLLRRRAFTLVSSRASSWSARGLQVTVDHCLGLRRADGTLLCAYPYYKAGPVTASVAATIVRLLEHTISTVLPGSTPVVLEVRAGKLHTRGSRRADRLDTLLAVEAQGYRTHWEEAA